MKRGRDWKHKRRCLTFKSLSLSWPTLTNAGSVRLCQSIYSIWEDGRTHVSHKRHWEVPHLEEYLQCSRGRFRLKALTEVVQDKITSSSQQQGRLWHNKFIQTYDEPRRKTSFPLGFSGWDIRSCDPLEPCQRLASSLFLNIIVGFHLQIYLLPTIKFNQ